MSSGTSIEWTDATWNPTRGCTRISEGCRNCYAEVMAARFSGFHPQTGKPQWGHGFAKMMTFPNGGGTDHRWTGKVAIAEENLKLPLTWKKPRKIFVNSTSDLFHEALPFGAIMRVFNVMWKTPHHTYQILTKRPDRMREFMLKWLDVEGEDFGAFKNARGPTATRIAHPSGRGQLFADMLEAMGEPPPGCAFPTFDWMEGMMYWPTWPADNIWLGTSIEDQERADERIPHLLATPAAVRFLSCEPLLGPVDLEHLKSASGIGRYLDALGGPVDPHADIPWKIDWVICGGESGHDARPMHPDWARSLRDQCAAAGVPFFFKQHGEWLHETQTTGTILPYPRDNPLHQWPDETASVKVGKSRAGHLLDGIAHHAFPHTEQVSA